MLKTLKIVSLIFGVVLILACKQTITHKLEVTATAYNSLPTQTHSQHPAITAWGDTLKPGMKAVAVSRDLIEKGLTHGTTIRINGLEGEYVVLDKMNKRWEKKIDIYMGRNVEKALRWGRREVIISWETKE